MRILSPFLILLLPAVAFQVRRFPEQVDWSHPRIAIVFAILAPISAQGLYLSCGSWRRVLGR